MSGLPRAAAVVAIALGLAVPACADAPAGRASGMAPASAAPVPTAVSRLDRCDPVWLRPDRGFTDWKECTPESLPADVAAQGGLVLLGSFWDVSDRRVAVPPNRRCGGPYTHAANATLIARIRAARPADAPPIAFVHLHRFELVPVPFAALPGFSAAFLLRTQRSLPELAAFFAGDPSSACRSGGCRWSDSFLGDPARDGGPRLRDRIARSGGPGAAEHAVYYLARSGSGKTTYWPRAAIADLRNPGYRAWRVAEAHRALQQGGYDALMLNHKFPQYRRDAFWVGGEGARDVAAMNRDAETLWSGPPTGYGFSEYVQGWAALGGDLRAAGVPYAVLLSSGVWHGRGLDDPATPGVDEGALIRDTAEGARFVIVSGLMTPGDADALEKRLAARGGRLVLRGPAARAGCLLHSRSGVAEPRAPGAGAP